MDGERQVDGREEDVKEFYLGFRPAGEGAFDEVKSYAPQESAA